MAVTLIKPSFRVPPLEELVTDLNGKPAFTRVTHGLQAANQATLWELFLQSGVELPQGAILDAGGGDGLFLALAPHMIFSRPEIGRRTTILVDIDPGKISKARQISDLIVDKYDASRRSANAYIPRRHSLNYVVQNPQDLATMSTANMTFPNPNNPKETMREPLPAIALVWSNSMFHWLREPDRQYAALNNFNTILKKGGVLCMSMSAGGTARDFLEAYHNVMVLKLKGYDRDYNPRGYLTASFRPDPIGSKPLYEIVRMIEESGFDVAIPVTLGEEATYEHPREYSATVKTYGLREFLSSVPHYGARAKGSLWGDIEEEFLSVLRKRGWQDGQPWGYRQFNNYIIAVKRAQSEPAKVGEPMGVSRVLNQRFLESAYRHLLLGDRFAIGILLDGNPEEIEGAATTVNLRDIFTGVLHHAADYWTEGDTNTCRISYRISEGALNLQIQVRTGMKQRLDEMFTQPFLDRLSAEKVVTGYTDAGDGTRIYEFRCPLFKEAR